jgi:hypothetical protein
MTELYWITRCSGIHGTCVFLMIVSGIIFIICTLGYIVNDDPDYPSEVRAKKNCITFLRHSLVFLIIGILGVLFVPTTKEALAIWGVGGTIDYLKSNPTSKQLPDKCIKALDKWVDGWTEKEDSVKVKRE